MTGPNPAVSSGDARTTERDSQLSLAGIRAILFYLDGTLRHSRPSFNHAIFDFAAEYGVSESGEKRRQALRWAHYYFAGSPEIVAGALKSGSYRDLFLTSYLQRYLGVYGCAPERSRCHLTRMASSPRQSARSSVPSRSCSKL